MLASHVAEDLEPLLYAPQVIVAILLSCISATPLSSLPPLYVFEGKRRVAGILSGSPTGAVYAMR